MDSQTSRRKNDGVLKCARQSAASTPLWLYPERQISLARREPNPLIPHSTKKQAPLRVPVVSLYREMRIRLPGRLTRETGGVVLCARVDQLVAQTSGAQLLDTAVTHGDVTLILVNVLSPTGA